MKIDYKVIILFVGLNVVIGSVSGGVAGYFSARATSYELRAANQVPGLAPTSTKPVVETTSTSTIKLLPLVSLDASSRAVPEGISTRKSPVGILYEHKKGSDPMLLPTEEIGRVVALTSDGWFVAPLSIVQNNRATDMVVWYEHAAYQVQKALADQVTQSVFLKTDARNLSVAPFASLTGSRTGAAVWIENNVADFVPTAIVSFRSSESPTAKSSDRIDRKLVLMGAIVNQEKGSPVWDSSGSLVGLVESSAQGKIIVIPSVGIAASLQSLLSDNQIKHATLNILSIDRSLVRLMPPGDGLPERGAWIKEEKKNQVVITKAGPGDLAGLKSGDVILQVDRDILDGSVDLGDIIAQYRPGSSVEVRVWRQGKEINLPLTLGSQVSSVPLN